MAGPLEGAGGMSGSSHHQSRGGHRWRAPWGVLTECPAAATTEAREDVDGGPPGGADGMSGSSHHRS
jgi:hypothetical protein